MSNFFRDWSAGQATPWLRSDRKTRLFTLKLLNVDDPLDADAIWNQSTGGDDTMIDSKANNAAHTSRRLQQALNAHRYTTTAYRGKAPIRRTYVFSDVVLWIAAHIWRDADIDGGNDLFYMTERLRYQHQQAFSEDEHYQQRPPHYAIMPLDNLATNEVICQFGMGVFLPNRNDEKTASISITRQGNKARTAHQFKPWIFFEPMRDQQGQLIHPPQGVKIERPVGLYATQKMLLIAQKKENSAIHSPLWIKATNEGEIIVNMNAKRPSTYGDDVYIRSETPRRDQTQTTCRFHAKGDKNDAITLLIDRSVKTTAVMDMLSPEPLPSTSGANTIIDNEEDTFGGLSQIDSSDDDQPDYLYQLELTGIVLPKLDSLKGRGARYLSHWLLYLDQDGALAQHESAIAWIIKGEKTATALKWKAHADKTWKTLDNSQPLPFFSNVQDAQHAEHVQHEKMLSLPAPELASKQFGILPLARHSFSIPLPLNSITLGRDMGDKNTADIPLGLLNQSSTLVYKNSKKHGNLAIIGLSGQHVQVHLSERRLVLQQISRSKTYVLNAEGSIRRTLTLKQPMVKLSANEGIMLGAFRFQFVESFMPEHRD
ncbi:MAG TPA: hypothetical protein ENJ33_05795 [Thiothrix sp.]|nr:hypothetical protein [Thiothrix sp.]